MSNAASGARSDEVLLREIDECVNKWEIEGHAALSNGDSNSYFRLKEKISNLLNLRYKFALFNDKEIKESARLNAARIIQNRREMESGFTVPRRENSEVASEQMNLTFKQLYDLHNISSSQQQGGEDAPAGVWEQYNFEEKTGKRRINSSGNLTEYENLHLLLDLRFKNIPVNTQMRLVANIWDKTRGFVNEPYEVNISNVNNGNVVGGESSQQIYQRVLFADTNRAELTSGLHLVLKLYTYEKIVRIAGELRSAPPTLDRRGGGRGGGGIDRSRDNDDLLKRPYACAVISLTDLKVHEISFLDTNRSPLTFSSQWYREIRSENEVSFATIHKIIIEELDSKILPLTGVPFDFIPTLDVERTSLAEQDNLTICKRMIPTDTFPDPQEMRCDFYITLESGEFSQDKKTAAKNVEVRCMLVDHTGNIRHSIKHCCPGGRSDHNRDYVSAVYYHNNAPTFGETFKVNISEYGTDFYLSHVLFLMYHCSSRDKDTLPSSSKPSSKKQLFAFSVLMLGSVAEGIPTPIADSTFTLPCYEIPPEMVGRDIEDYMGMYFDENVNLVPRTLGRSLSNNLALVNESVMISTRLVSSYITQDPTLHQLLNIDFKEHDDALVEVYDECTTLPSHLLLKYLRSIMEKCLRSITSAVDNSEPAFRLLVRVFDVFSRKSYSRHRPLLNKYINEVFSYNTVHEYLLSHVDTSLLWMDYPTISPNRPLVEAMIRCIDSLLQLANKSIQLSLGVNDISEIKSSELTANKTTASFFDNLRKLLNRLVHILGSHSHSQWGRSLKLLVIAQFPAVLKFTCSYLRYDELSIFARDFLYKVKELRWADDQTVDDANDADGGEDVEFTTLSLKILDLSEAVVMSTLFVHTESRDVVLECVVGLLQGSLKKRKNIKNGYTSNDKNSSGYTQKVFEVLEKLVARLLVVGDTESDISNAKDLCMSVVDILYEQLVTNARIAEQFPPSSGGCTVNALIQPMQIVNQSDKSLASMKHCIHIFIGLLDFLRFDGTKELIVESGEDIRLFMLKILSILVMVLQQVHTLYPYSWVAIRSQIAKSMIRCLHVIFSVMAETKTVLEEVIDNACLPPSTNLLFKNTDSTADSTTSITFWTMMIEVVVYILVCPVLCIDQGDDQNSAAAATTSTRIEYVHNNFDDLRETSLPLLLGAWGEIEGDTVKMGLVEQMIQVVLLLIGSSNATIQEAGASILADIFMLDYDVNNGSTSYSTNECVRHSFQIYQSVTNSGHNISQNGIGGNNAKRVRQKNMSLHTENANFTKESICSFSKEHFEHFFDHRLLNHLVSTVSDDDHNLNIKQDANVVTMIDDVSQFIKLVNSLEMYTNSSSANTKELFEVAIHLMGFALEKGMLEEYCSVLHSLVQEYCNLNMFVEASYLLTSHADMLAWDDTVLVEIVYGFRQTSHLPSMLSWKRRVFLIERAIDLCNREEAQDWERCSALLDRLIQEHRTHHEGDVHGEIKSYLNRQIELHEKMRSVVRLPPSLFMVGYYGNFEEGIRNNELVYRRTKAESVAEFSEYIRGNYPDAKIMHSHQLPSEQQLHSMSEQFIRIVKVKPWYDSAAGGRSSGRSKLKTSQSNNKGEQTDVFTYSTSSRRDPSISNEFLDLWLTQHFITVETPLPSLTHRAEVIQMSASVLNPIEAAIGELSERNKKIQDGILEMQNADREETASQQVTMELSGTVDAAVNGGVANYYSILSGEFRTINPAIVKDIEEKQPAVSEHKLLHDFKVTFQAHLDVVKRAVKWHREKCHPSMQPLHEHLEASFEAIVVTARKYLDNCE